VIFLGRAVALHPVVTILRAILAVPIAAVVTAVGADLRGHPVVGFDDLREPEPETSRRHAQRGRQPRWRQA
jgi:hypothetical protein